MPSSLSPLGALAFVLAAGMLWAVEVLAWRGASMRGMDNFRITAWTAAMMGVGGTAMLGYSYLPAKAGAAGARRAAAPADTEALEMVSRAGLELDGLAPNDDADPEPSPSTDRGAVAMCICGAIAWLFACVCYNIGMQGMPSAAMAIGIAGVVQSICILVAAWTFFGERIIDFKGWAGLLLMMAGIIVVNMRDVPQDSSPGDRTEQLPSSPVDS
eukprot:TRINITY_DN7087_c0_g1_i1.p2 TRINITY_DN7087_c0_g1~~TRINITY_DN7087_c0_g1_i1.p2  ORF type:complete len:241 (+),score=65.36 TRINITY_DN7087_c0_g1_i1:83-724(+)